MSKKSARKAAPALDTRADAPGDAPEPAPPAGEASTQLQLQLAQQMLQFATQQAGLLQQALPCMLPVSPKALRAKLDDVIDGLRARPAIEGLKEAGLTEQQAVKVRCVCVFV